MLRQKSWIDEANERVHIADVLTSLGIAVPESVRNGGNKKVYCPFGFYHSDGGISKAMRVYGNSNTAYCFSCSKRYSPVTLTAAKRDCSWQNAAFILLEDIGYAPKSLEERWEEATIKPHENPDILALADALKMYCSGIITDWASKQLEDTIASKLNQCLDLLSVVKTDEDAVKWLTVCKKVMKDMLEKL